jgi:hypothetical protein
MSEDPKILAESHAAEAVQAISVAAEATEKAPLSQMEAIAEKSDERIAALVSSSISEFFNRGISEKRFIDIGRIPFICDDIRGIHGQIAEQGNDIRWIKWLVMGMAGGIGVVAITLITK